MNRWTAAVLLSPVKGAGTPAAVPPNGTRIRVTWPGGAITVSFQPRSFAAGAVGFPSRYWLADSAGHGPMPDTDGSGRPGDGSCVLTAAVYDGSSNCCRFRIRNCVRCRWMGCASPVVLTMSHSSTVFSLGCSISVVLGFVPVESE